MDNRRPTGTSPEKPLSREGYYKKPGENSFGQRTFQPRDNRFQSRDEKYAPRRDDTLISHNLNIGAMYFGKFQN